MRWHYRHTVLSLCTIAFFVTMVGRLAISPVVPQITDAFAISNTAIGIALTGMWMTYALSQFPSGVLGNRYGERKIILVAVGGTGVMSFLIAVSSVYVIFVICVIGLGAVAGLHYSTATTLLSRTYDNIGTAIGIHTIGAPVGGLIAPTAAAWIGTRYGWRPAVAIGALVSLPVFVLLYIFMNETTPQNSSDPLHERVQIEPIIELLLRPKIAFTVVIAGSGTFVWQGVASFLPTFLVEYHGLSSTAAGIVFSSYFVIQAITKPALGALSDNYPRDIGISVSLLTSISGMVLFVVGPGHLGIIAAIALIGTGLGMAVTVEPRFVDQLSESEQSIGFGLVRTIYMVVSSLGSVAMGFLSDIFGWAVAFLILSGLLTIIFVTVIVNFVLKLGY